MTGALERRRASFVGAALTALQRSVAALPGIKSSDALAAVLSLATPKDTSSAVSQQACLLSVPKPVHKDAYVTSIYSVALLPSHPA